MTAGPFQWVSDGILRHGVPEDLVAGEQGTTLCGEPVVIPRDPLSKASERVRCAPTCEPCDIAWRKQMGYSPRPRYGEVSLIEDLPTSRTPRPRRLPHTVRPANGARS